MRPLNVMDNRNNSLAVFRYVRIRMCSVSSEM